jgi:hypothetical protein
MSVVSVVCFRAEVSATSRLLLRRPTERGVSDMDLATLTTRAVEPWKESGMAVH